MPSGACDPATPRRTRAQSAGFIIVAVLWIVGALAALAVMYSLYVRQTALSFVDHNEQLQAQAMAISGIELAAYQVTKAAGPPPLQGRFSFNQGSATIDARFVSENSRIDLNFAPKQLLAGLFTGLGLPNDEALTDADRIIGWRSPVKPGQNDPEAGIYQAARKAYGPRHGPFQHPDELALVADLRPALVDRILPYVTVYSGRPEVNVLIAPPQVLAAVPGMTAEVLQQLVKTRHSNPQDIAKAQMGSAAQYITLDAAAADRVTVTVQFSTGARIRSQTVILLSKANDEPYRVLSWLDDAPSGEEREAAEIE